MGNFKNGSSVLFYLPLSNNSNNNAKSSVSIGNGALVTSSPKGKPLF